MFGNFHHCSVSPAQANTQRCYFASLSCTTAIVDTLVQGYEFTNRRAPPEYPRTTTWKCWSPVSQFFNEISNWGRDGVISASFLIGITCLARVESTVHCTKQ